MSASKRNVQRAAPSGGSLQANMTNLASTSPVNFGGAPGQPLSYSAACNPPERKRRHTLRTVLFLHKTASATSWSVRFWPWLRSLRSRIRALVWVRAGALPVRIRCSSSVRSSLVRSIGVCFPMSHRIPSQAKKRKILYNEVLVLDHTGLIGYSFFHTPLVEGRSHAQTQSIRGDADRKGALVPA